MRKDYHPEVKPNAKHKDDVSVAAEEPKVQLKGQGAEKKGRQGWKL